MARIIRRIKSCAGRVPLPSRHDTHEHVFGPPLPDLFQRLSCRRPQVFSPDRVSDLLR